MYIRSAYVHICVVCILPAVRCRRPHLRDIVFIYVYMYWKLLWRRRRSRRQRSLRHSVALHVFTSSSDTVFCTLHHCVVLQRLLRAASRGRLLLAGAGFVYHYYSSQCALYLCWTRFCAYARPVNAPPSRWAATAHKWKRPSSSTYYYIVLRTAHAPNGSEHEMRAVHSSMHHTNTKIPH